MRNVLVNALSVCNQSGLHVLVGHVRQLLDALREDWRFTILAREGQTALKTLLGDQVAWVTAPPQTGHWLARTIWEQWNLAAIARNLRTDVYFSPSGVATAKLPLPQVVFCQNPWALVPSARRMADVPKAWLQRLAYRRAMTIADVMVFNSRFMQAAYRRNAGRPERHGVVVYQAADDETHRRAAQWVDRPRKPGQILCVSAMGSHKNVEVVVAALRRLAVERLVDARLLLVGEWPDAAYERKIQRLVSASGLDGRVDFAGFVARETLDRYYAESRVFCLMSRCESFGIPSIEAQIFGTPVVGSNVCAVPEICGDGGVFLDPDDEIGVADALQRLLTDANEWRRLSSLARRNARLYRWEDCSRPLAGVFRNLPPFRSKACPGQPAGALEHDA